MNRKRFGPGVVPLFEAPDEAIWEAADEAFWGEGTTRDERARSFGAMMQEAVARGACRQRGAEPSLGERLKTLRMERGLTLSRASQRAGVDGSAWRSWEANHRIPSVLELRGVVDLFGPERCRELDRLRQRAPEACLARTLATPSPSRVARAVDTNHGATAAAVLEVRNLDPHVRRALEAWCRETRGNSEEAVLVAALEEARAKSEAEREGWILAVCAGVELDGDEP